MKKAVLITYLSVCCVFCIFASGMKDSATSSDRAMYLSEQGYITPANQIDIESYLAQVDYEYPLPKESPVGFTLDAESKGELAYVQLGMKGQKTAFKDLPKFNIAFVIDCSGSMYSQNKLDWVKDSFNIFIENVRPTDYVSLIMFSNTATLLFPATQMKSYVERQEFKKTVMKMDANGGTNVYDGLSMGYNQVVANYDASYNNRVILLTDGEHNDSRHSTQEIVNLAAKYNKLDINVSCIGLGTSADVNLMNEIAEDGGGSSRFISNHEKMIETFSTELDRLLVPAARNLSMNLAFAEGVTILDTWGYKNALDGQNVSYFLETIHNGDYETIVTELYLSESFDKNAPVAWLSYDYKGMDGTTYSDSSIPVYLTVKTGSDDLVIENTRILQSEAYIRFARALIAIAEKKDAINNLQREYNALTRGTSDVDTRGEPEMPNLEINTETNQVREEIIFELNYCLNIIEDMHADLMSIDDMLPGNQFLKDLQILDNYRVTFERCLATYVSTVQE